MTRKSQIFIYIQLISEYHLKPLTWFYFIIIIIWLIYISEFRMYKGSLT